MSNIYHNNLLAIQKTNTKLYKTLANIKTNEAFEVYMQNDSREANMFDKRDKTILYATNPLDEIKNKYKELKPYNQYRFLYIFGIGNGYLLELLLENPTLQKIYLFEPELEMIYIVLNLIDFSSEILLGKLNIIDVEQISFSFLNGLLKADEKYHFKSYNLFINTLFYEKYQSEIIKTNQTLIEVFRYHVNAAGNDYKDELLGLENFLENIPAMLKNPSLKELINRSDISGTAIITATGPSLYKQLPLLKEIQDKVAIISVDASMPILEKWGIKPDIVTSIERVGATARFYKNISKEFQKDTIFAISAVADDDILYHIKDGIMQLSMRSTGEHYRFFGLDEWGYLGEGMSSANLAYELASIIGYKNIVFIGQDLAFGENFQSHSEGHIFGKNEIKNTSEEEYNIAYGGNGKVKTRKIWKMFLKGLEKQIYKNNQVGNITTINATEGGSRIDGTKEIPFKTFCLGLPNIKKEKIILEKTDYKKYKKFFQQSLLKVEEAISLGNSMQKQASKLLSKIIQQTSSQDIASSMINNLMKEINKIRSKYYKSEFTSFYISLLSPMVMHIEYDIYKVMTMPENTQKEIFDKNLQIIQIHQEWLKRVIANVNNIIDILKAKQNRLKEYGSDNQVKYIFYDSLKDKDNIKVISKKGHNAITFFANFLNYNSANFINIIKYTIKIFPNIQVKAICFGETDILDTKRVFGSIFPKIECIAPKNISEFLNITDIYIKDRSFIKASLDGIENLLRTNGKKVIVVDINEKEFNTLTMLENINYKKDEFKEIKIYKNNKLVDALKPKFTNNIADIKAKCFEYMIEKQDDFEFKIISSKDEKTLIILPSYSRNIYQISFDNSLETTFDKTIVKDKNGIGLFIVKEIINNIKFQNFLFELFKKNSNIIFYLYYFDDFIKNQFVNIITPYIPKNFIKLIKPYTYTQITSNICVWINSSTKQMPNLKKILSFEFDDVYLFTYNERYELPLWKYDKFNQDHPVFSNPEYFGFNKDIVTLSKQSLSILTTHSYLNQNDIDFNKPAKEFVFQQLTLALKSKDYRYFISNWIKKNKEYHISKTKG